MSYVAGILDQKGGLRVIVAHQRNDFEDCHCMPGERVLIVPNLMVQEPVPWDRIPWVIRQVELHLWRWIREHNEPYDLAINNYLARMMNP